MMEELQKLLMTDQLNSVPVLIYVLQINVIMRSYSREQIKSVPVLMIFIMKLTDL